MLTQAFLWRLLDLTETDGRPIDLVVATKFPSYVVRHPSKLVWLVHQFRQAYELDRTDLGQFGECAEDRALRRAIHRLDRVALGEATRLFAISQNVADRLERSTGSTPRCCRPAAGARLPLRRATATSSSRSNRLDRAKRVDLLLEAAAPSRRSASSSRATGPDRERLEELRTTRGLNGRVRFAGRVAGEPSSPTSTRVPRRLLRARRRGLRDGSRTRRSSPTSPS